MFNKILAFICVVACCIQARSSGIVALSDLSAKKPKNYHIERTIMVSNEDGVKAVVNNEGMNLKIESEGKQLEVKIEKAQRAALEHSSPEFIRRSMRRSLAQVGVASGKLGGFVGKYTGKTSGYLGSAPQKLASYAILHYPMEAMGFYIALTAMSVWECLVNVNIAPSQAQIPLNLTVAEHPTACSELGASLTDPITHISFALFIQTNKHTSRAMNLINQKYRAKYNRNIIPAHSIRYLGLAAGSIVSTIAGEFLMDRNIRYVASNFFRQKNPIEQRRFDRALDSAYETWSPSNMGIYGHHVVSLLASAATASIATSIGLKTLKAVWNTKQAAEATKLGGVSTQIRPVNINAGKVIRYAIPSFRLAVKASTRSTTIGFVAVEVASLLHFFFWEHTVYGPFFSKLLMQEESSAEMKYYQTNIVKQLATLSSKRDGNLYLPARTPIQNFIYDSLHSKENIKVQTNYLKSGNFACINHDLSDTNKLSDLTSKLKELENKDIPSNGYTYTREVCPSLVQLPLLLDESFTQNLNTYIDLSSDNNILDNLLQHHEKLLEYYSAISSRVQSTLESWRSFFEPYEDMFLTVENFYSKLIEHKGKNYFPNGFDYWKSKGVIDSIFYNIRTFEDAIMQSSNRLHWENMLAKIGLDGKAIVKLSDNQLRPIHSILSNMKTLFGKPNAERKAAIDFLNNGFNPVQLGRFEKYDYQVRNYAIEKGIKFEVLQQLQSNEIQEIIDFLDEVDDHNEFVYLYALNTGQKLSSLQRKNKDELVEELGGKQSILVASMSTEDSDTDLEIEPMVGESIHFESKAGGLVSQEGIYYNNILEKILIKLTCGKSLNELSNLLEENKNSMIRRAYVLGPLQFVSPRLLEVRNRNICSYTKPGYRHNHVHNEFIDNNKKYANLLDYALQNINVTTKEFVDSWWPRVYERNEADYLRYFEKKKEALKAHVVEAFYDDTYDRFSSGMLGSMMNIGKNMNTDINIKRLSFANGIKNLSDDFVDYYLRVLALIIPRDNKEFLENMYVYIDSISRLAIHSENYEEIRSEFQEYERSKIRDKINNDGWSNSYIEEMNHTDLHNLVVIEMLHDMSFYFKNELSLGDIEDGNYRELIQIADAIIQNIGQIIQQKSISSQMINWIN